MTKIKEYVLKTGFKNTQEEIYFFKHIKPQFIAKLIYYNAVYKIESKKPNETKSAKKYINNELKKLKKFFAITLNFINITVPTIHLLMTNCLFGESITSS